MIAPMSPTDLRSLSGPRRALSLGYYDGTTNGLVKFEESGLAFRYDLVSWDWGENWRVFCLAPLLPNDFEAAVEVLSVLGKPRWPCWCPRWEFSSDAQKCDVERALESISRRSGPYRIAILSRNLCTSTQAAVSFVGELEGAVEQFSRDGKTQSFGNWLALFGANALGESEETGL